MKKSFGEILIQLVEIVAEVYLKTKSEESLSYETDGAKKKIIIPNIILIKVVKVIVFIVFVITELQK